MLWPTPLTDSDPALERRVLDLFQVLLDLPEAERVEWIEAHSDLDSPLRARLLAMLAGDRLANMRTGGASGLLDDDRLPERIGAYRITGLIGQGGMGAVYRGERMTGDFDHVAAIKLIRPGALSDTLVARFMRERQTLASLSHPNIARLFDGGATERGDPYIVMEYVDGVPLGTWIETETTSRTQRTWLFLDICSAVGFAHQNLIVHRDITPSNILVARDGTAKLIDFGIARPPVADSEAAPSARKSLAGLSLTPGYAAPERLAGEVATTLSDVYSLGILLDKLLKDDTDADLSAIIAQASATDPADRYPSVDALADDLKAWRDGHMVAARKGGRRYALGKFVGRHRFVVAMSAIGLLFLIGALAYALIANARAERRFDETRGIAKALLFDVYDDVSKVSGSTRARERLAKTGLAYLDVLAADPNAPLDVRVEAGRGYLRLAQVTGDGQSAQLGKSEIANVLLGKAEVILKPLHANNPSVPEVTRAYAELLVEQSRINLYNNNKTDLARNQAATAYNLLNALGPPTSQTAKQLALAIQAEGDIYLWVDDFAKARAKFEQAEAFIASLPPKLATEPGMMMVRSSNLKLYGEALHKLKDAPAARIALDRAVEINRILVRRATDDPAIQRKLAISLWYRAVVHRSNYRDTEAGASIDEAQTIARKILSRDQNDAGALKLFMLTSELSAQILGDQRRFPESYAMGEEVQNAQEKLVGLAGNTPGALRSMATSLATNGGNHYNGGDYAGACMIWRKALGIFDSLETNGALTETDRKNGKADLQRYLASSCDNGQPRAGMGKEM
jgi:eukaryotic-like serine/threonine-protein kinase